MTQRDQILAHLQAGHAGTGWEEELREVCDGPRNDKSPSFR